MTSMQVASLHADIGAKVDGFQAGAAKVLGGLGKLALSVGAVTTAIEMMSQAFDFAKEGAQLERLADSGAEIARQYGGNMDLIIRKVKEASLGTVSEMDIIRSSNKAMMLGLGADAEQLANLMEIAAFRGRAMGVSTTQAFDDIVRGIGRTSPMILDNLGIVISAKDTYANYAEQIGKSDSELTKQEKTQALLNRVLQEGNTLLDEAGGLVEDNASQYEKLTAEVNDYKDSVKKSFNEAITPSLEAFLDLADAMDAASEATGRTDQRSRIYLGSLQLQAEQENELKERINDASTARWEGIASIHANTAALDDAVLSGDDYEASLERMSDANKAFLSTLGSMQSDFESFEREYKSINEDMNLSDEERQRALQDLSAEHERATREIVLGLLEQKLAQDGLTDEELNLLLEKGLAWGLYSATVVAETRKAIAEANMLAATLNGLPTSKTFTYTVVAGGDVGVVTSGAVANQRVTRRASGGAVNAGQPYMVGEQGMELFVPSQNGNIVPNNALSKNNNQDVIAAIAASRLDERKLARSIVSAMAQVG